MKTLNKLFALAFAVFLFFNFSNFNSLDDLFQTLKPENTVKGFEKAIVKEVIDGDTIKVELAGGREETVRMLLIDTPETVAPGKPVQPFGKEARNYLKRTLIKDSVIEIERGIEERDRYGRLLAYVWLDGKNVNLELVKEGLARVAYIYEPNTKYIDEFKKGEYEAKKSKKGIWSIDGYVSEDGFNYP